MKIVERIITNIKLIIPLKLKVFILCGITILALMVVFSYYRPKQKGPSLRSLSSSSINTVTTTDTYKAMSTLLPVTAKKQSFSNTLYFAGKIQPLTRTSVVSPVDGVVKRVSFTYGDEIQDKQLMFEINSPKHQHIFQEILTRYLRAKQEVGLLEAKVKNSHELYKQGIISKDELIETNKNYYLNKLAFLQEKTNLDMILKYHPDIADISKLSINDTDIVTKIIDVSAQTEDVSIFAPKSGVVLFPEGREDEYKVKDGSEVRAGQVLAYLGDTNSLIVKIEINESNIHQIKVGEKAIVTSNAFPNLRLVGQITNIDSQAIGHQDLPVFTAIVTAPRVTEEQKKIVRIGMGVKVAVTFEHEPQILIPVGAVVHEGGTNKVKIISKEGQITEEAVTVAGTTADSAIITSGLNAGDQVVSSNSVK